MYQLSLKSTTYPLDLFGYTVPCYAAIIALILNIAVAVIGSVIMNAIDKSPRLDQTVPSDYVG